MRDLLSKGPGPKGDPACVGTWRIRSEAGGSRSDPAPALEDSASGPAGGERPVVDGLITLGLHCTEHNRHMRPSVEEVQLALADLRSTEGGPSAFFALPSRLMLDDKASVSPFYIASGTGSASAGAHGPAAQPQGLRCSSCCEAERDTFFLPCQHAVMCAACASALVGIAHPPDGQPEVDASGVRISTAVSKFPTWGPGEFLCPLCRGKVFECRLINRPPGSDDPHVGPEGKTGIRILMAEPPYNASGSLTGSRALAVAIANERYATLGLKL